MAQDQEFYAFIVAPSAKSKLRKIRITHKLLYTTLGVTAAITILSLIGLLSVLRYATLEYQLASSRSEVEELRRQNDAYRANYDRLFNRVAYVEDVSDYLAREIRNEGYGESLSEVGQGGPEVYDNIDLPDFDRRTEELERELRQMSDQYRDEQAKLATIPTGWPVEGYLTDSFGNRRNPFGGGGVEGHEGQDISAAYGAPVASTADGLVVYAAARSGYGNVIVIYHGNGITTRYGHLSQINVEAGQRIRRGDEIGKVGSTGRSTGPHCHYEVRVNDVPVNPHDYAR